MKTLTLLSAAMVLSFSFASAQEKIATDASSKPKAVSATAMPVAIPSAAVKQQQITQQNSQSPTSPTKAPATSVPTSPKPVDKASEPAPPVDNKIAVSDPGVPSDKSSNKKAAGSDTKSNEKKNTTNTGVSPK